MPRRRLHGITQKRRKKPATRLLKLHGSTERTRATLSHAPFERDTELERDDLEFQEIMREMGVKRSSWSGQVPERTRAVEGVIFACRDGDDRMFRQAMDFMGVGPAGAAAEEPVDMENPKEAREALAVRDEHMDEHMEEHMEEHLEEHTSAQDCAAAEEADSPPEPPALRFESGADDQALLEGLLEAGEFSPGKKYEGAPAIPDDIPRRSPPRPDPENSWPDSQIDLHGKTQEEAIMAVQNFILTSHNQRLRNVLIITGKGRNSGSQGPVLRDLVRSWLERNGDRFVRSFDWAPPRHGGQGALWVCLR
ncbi:MAG: Smr/MutS family protein [Deltaproteobacteria bacterium]|nr:Smr/MutS family protein [Deltaproteobacteria bacterium]